LLPEPLAEIAAEMVGRQNVNLFSSAQDSSHVKRPHLSVEMRAFWFDPAGVWVRSG
jgi:hypothetical protein